MNVNFYKKRLQQYRSYLQVSSKTHSHTFYQILGKIVVADFEKIGEFLKNSRQISLERLELRRSNSVIWGITLMPTCVIFSEFSVKGLGNAVASNFRKNRWGANG